MVRRRRTSSVIPFAFFENARTERAAGGDGLEPLDCVDQSKRLPNPVSNPISRKKPSRKFRKLQLVKVHPSAPSPTSPLRHSVLGLNPPPPRMILTALTDRQLEVQGVVHQLQAKMIRIQTNSDDPNYDKNTVEEIEEEVTITRLKADVEILKDIRESQWALGASDDLPKDWEVLQKYKGMKRRF